MDSESNPVSDSLIRLGLAAQAEGLPHLIIGGNAVIHYGIPRFTRDIDFLIPDAAIDSWKALLVSLGYQCYHASGAFLQFEVAADEPDGAPVDLMSVDESTWEKLSKDADTDDMAAGYIARWPSPLHLVALKLHAWRGTFRTGREQDWSDIVKLVERCEIDLSDASTLEIVLRYGGADALEKLRHEIS